MHIRKTLIESFWDLPESAQHGMARFLVGAKLGDIVETRTQAGLEYEVHYFRHGTVHKIGWDEELQGLCGGTESLVVATMVATLESAAQAAIARVGGTLRHLKIKRDSKDGRPFLHVHYVTPERHLDNIKLEMNGAPHRSGLST